MDSSLTSASSVQQVNAALLAQHQAAVAAQKTATTQQQGPSFASTLDGIERQELAPPVQLARPAAASSAAAQATQSDVGEAADSAQETCAEPKISRSDRMACAEKATHVSYEDDDFGFADFVDLINPLQHIPILGTLYRELTGDTIKPEVQVAGSLAFGVATGSVVLSAISGIASAAMEQQSGKEPLVQVADALWGDKVSVPDAITEDKVMLADASSVAQEGTPTANVVDVQQNQQVAETKEIAAPDAAAKTAPAVQQKPLLASAKILPSTTGGTRMGNIIYASPMLQNAARVSRTTTASAATTAAAPTQSSSQPLPPQLIEDMMIKALDKYKAAHMLQPAGSEAIAVD